MSHKEKNKEGKENKRKQQRRIKRETQSRKVYIALAKAKGFQIMIRAR